MSRRTSNNKWRLTIQEEGGDCTERIVDTTFQATEVLISYELKTDKAGAQLIRLVWGEHSFVPFSPTERLWDIFEFEYEGGSWQSVDRLAWGLRDEVPWTAPAAWGCRAIDLGGGRIDIPYDRLDFIGCKEQRDRLRGKLTLHLPMPVLEERVRDAEDEVFDIWDGDGMTVKGRRSGGYVYIAAWAS